MGEQTYWNQPGGKTDYTGNFDLALAHKLSPRASVSIEASAVYSRAPNFALVNAPTNAGSGGSYLDGNAKIDLTYGWGSRIATVTSYGLSFNILQTGTTGNLYQHTIGTQFRYTVSPRTTVTAELRATYSDNTSDAAANTYSTYYLLGLDSFISARIRNTVSAGIETETFTSGGRGQTSPYFESDTTLALPRQAGLTWTNTYGFQNSSTAAETIKSYRTGLTYTQPLSTKLVASLTVAYNNLQDKNSSVRGAGYTQNQFQVSAALNYTLSPRLSLSLSYNYVDLLTSQINASYTRDQIYLGASYMFR